RAAFGRKLAVDTSGRQTAQLRLAPRNRLPAPASARPRNAAYAPAVRSKTSTHRRELPAGLANLWCLNQAAAADIAPHCRVLRAHKRTGTDIFPRRDKRTKSSCD